MKYLHFLTSIACFPVSLLAATTTEVKKEVPNVLLICIDDLRPELKCFGAEYIHSPNIDKLASQGRSFNHHYTNAPTCGA
jgi:iduronate 2-sulfatase